MCSTSLEIEFHSHDVVCKSCHERSPACVVPSLCFLAHALPSSRTGHKCPDRVRQRFQSPPGAPTSRQLHPLHQPWAWRKLPTRAPGSPLIKRLCSQPQPFSRETAAQRELRQGIRAGGNGQGGPPSHLPPQPGNTDGPRLWPLLGPSKLVQWEKPRWASGGLRTENRPSSRVCPAGASEAWVEVQTEHR